MLNVKDLPEYTNKINAAIDDAMANNGTQDSPAVDELISYYTGPGTGLEYRDGKVRKVKK